jgi:hypothetical protein
MARTADNRRIEFPKLTPDLLRNGHGPVQDASA